VDKYEAHCFKPIFQAHFQKFPWHAPVATMCGVTQHNTGNNHTVVMLQSYDTTLVTNWIEE